MSLTASICSSTPLLRRSEGRPTIGRPGGGASTSRGAQPRLRLSPELLPPPPPRLWSRLLRAVEGAARFFHRAPPQLPIHALGQKGEDLAYWSLRARGYTIVARNFRLPRRQGEVDLIAVEGQPPTLVFVEVKTRSRSGNFPAEDAVDAAKRQHLIRLARAYRRRHPEGVGHVSSQSYRFDLVTIYDPLSPQPQINLHRDAFRDD